MKICILAAVIAQIAAQGCVPEGTPAGEIRTGVFLDIARSEVVCNNLAGMGPDTNCAQQEIRYAKVGIDFGEDGSTFTEIDLVVTNVSKYEPNNVIRNGRTEEQTGEIAQINMAGDQSTMFKYEWVNTGTNDRVIFSTGYSMFMFDLDIGEAGRLAESMVLCEDNLNRNLVTTIEEACSLQGQPDPCLDTTLVIEQVEDDPKARNCWKTIATERGYGRDNVESPSQILQPVADMTEFEKAAARKYVNYTFEVGPSVLFIRYSLTAESAGTESGRNFQFSALGAGIRRDNFLPCYSCDEDTAECEACGSGVPGPDNSAPDLPACPEDSYAADCPADVNAVCRPGYMAYPACKETCAVGCTKECTQYGCYKYDCYKCGTDECAEGSECYANACSNPLNVYPGEAICEKSCKAYVCYNYNCYECGSPGCEEGSACYESMCKDGPGKPGQYPTMDACNAAGMDGTGCKKAICEPEVTKKCYMCDDPFLLSIDVNYCENYASMTNPLFNKPGYNCKVSCSPPVARKDPHLYLPHGARADFRGENNVTFVMLSAKDLAFNVKFEEADFAWSRRLVHGTKMSAAYWVVRTTTGKVLKVEYNTSCKAGGVVYEEGHRAVTIKEDAPALVVDNVQIALKNKKLSVLVVGKWHAAASIAAFPFGNLDANKNKKLLDIEIEALYDADRDVVAPHGIFGQAYDGDTIGISGKMDKDRAAESTTAAQAEGAIEGTWKDYRLLNNFDTDFKYSRFDKLAAKPRDVSKLTGSKATAPKADGIVGASDLPAVE